MEKILKLNKLFSFGLLMFFISELVIASQENSSKQKNVTEVIDASTYKKRLLAQNESEEILLQLSAKNNENALLIKKRKGSISKGMQDEHKALCEKEQELWANFNKKKEELQNLAFKYLDLVSKIRIDFECGN